MPALHAPQRRRPAARRAWINVAGFAAMAFSLIFVNLVVAGLYS